MLSREIVMEMQKKKKIIKNRQIKRWLHSHTHTHGYGWKTAPNQRQQIQNAHTIFFGIISVGLLSLPVENWAGVKGARVLLLCTILRRLKVRAWIQISVNLAACPALAFCFLSAGLPAVVYIFLRSAWVLFACGKNVTEDSNIYECSYVH